MKEFVKRRNEEYNEHRDDINETLHNTGTDDDD
jgi:hypothetical protein